MDNELTGIVTGETDEAEGETQDNQETGEAIPGEAGQQAYAQALEQARMELLQEAQARAQLEAEQRQREEALAPWREAIAETQDEFMPSYEKLGKLTEEALRQQMQANAVNQASEAHARQVLDQTVEKLYGDVLPHLSDEERAALSRENFSSLQEQSEAVFQALAVKQAELSGAGSAGTGGAGTGGLTPQQLAVAGIEDSDVGGEHYTPSSEGEDYASALRSEVMSAIRAGAED